MVEGHKLWIREYNDVKFSSKSGSDLSFFYASRFEMSMTRRVMLCRKPQIYPDADPEFWMYSENLFEVAERGGCGYKRGSGFPLHFEKAFTLRIDDFPHYAYTTRRIW